MKENELMIGDWVLVNGNPMQIQAVNDIDGEIMAGDELYCLIEDRVHSEDKIEPVPLTAEILEKNGWKYNPTIKAYEWKDKAFYISIHLDEKTRIYVVNDYIFGMALGAVHELQHALRLCEIDKTIGL